MDAETDSRKRKSFGDAGYGDDFKKVKSENPPSKVIHVRNIPNDAAEDEISEIATPFGPIYHLLHMRSKQQALIQFELEDHATSMINYYAYVTPTIRSQPVYVQYSTHKELKVAEKQQGPPSYGNDDQQEPARNGSPDIRNSKVLRVSVENMMYPCTIEVLQQLFTKYGVVQKIVIFTKNDHFQALVQYQHAADAKTGRDRLDGQNIYNGCNTLRIDYSKLAELTVKTNSNRSRDFTKPDLPHDQPRLQLGAGVLPLPFGAPHLPALLGNNIGMQQSYDNGPPQHHRQGSSSRPGAVLIVSNLIEGKIKSDELFILFGNYGDVLRVKILFNKQDTALIQFVDGHQAQIAQENLNGVRFMGKELCINKSKHSQVNLPRKEDEIEKEYTKDYTSSNLHRFKKPGSKNFQNIFPPIRTLHLSNIPETTREEDLVDLFHSTGGTIEGFRFFPKDRRMALLKLGSVEEALIGLIRHHNHKLSESNHLRVSFAKNDI